jgi:glycosyltransferase involved in cell wall biosynthesis
MPVYNGEKYVSKAINSVLSQSYSNWELLIVDDGSTDKTGNIVASFTDSRIYSKYQKNRGLGEARNAGIRDSQGEIIALLDADDLWDSEFLKKMVYTLNHHQEAAAVYCGFRYINNLGQSVGNTSLQVVHPDIFHETLIRKGNWLVPCAVVFRKKIAEKIGLFDGALWGVEDSDFWGRLSADHTFVGLSEILVSYRIHDGNMSRNPDHMMTGAHRLMEKRHGPPTGDIGLWSETKIIAYARLFRNGTVRYLAYGNIQESARYFQLLLEIMPENTLSIGIWRDILRVHLPVEFRNDQSAKLDWELAEDDIFNLLSVLKVEKGSSRRLNIMYPGIKNAAFLALADEAGKKGELKRAFTWLWKATIVFPLSLLTRRYWGTIFRGIFQATKHVFAPS